MIHEDINAENRVFVRVARSGLSSFPIFFLFSIFFLNLFSFSLFLAPRVRISDNIGHMAQRKV